MQDTRKHVVSRLELARRVLVVFLVGNIVELHVSGVQCPQSRQRVLVSGGQG